MTLKKSDDLMGALHELLCSVDCLPFNYQPTLLRSIQAVQEEILILAKEHVKLQNENHRLLEERVADLVEILRAFKVRGGEKN